MSDEERRIVRNIEEVHAFYYYKDKSSSPVPKKYPCVMWQEHNDGGIGGPYVSHGFEYAPDGVDFYSWAVGKGCGHLSKDLRDSLEANRKQT